MKVKVISWNIWKGKFLNQVIKTLKELDAEVVGLQEVIEKEGGERKINTAQTIAQKLGYQYIYCKAFTTDRHTPTYDLGNAVLSRFPIKKHQCHSLSGLILYQNDSVTEPRGAAEAKIEIAGREIKFISAHLAFSQKLEPVEIRKIQLENLLKIIDPSNTVLMGDFNSLPDSEEIKKLAQVLVNTDPNPLSPTWTNFRDPDQPQYRIDYIFTSNDLKTQNFQIINSSASDHYPILATLTL